LEAVIMLVRVGIGQDSHRFGDEATGKPLVLGGVRIPGCPGLEANSDGDVVLHALTNAVSGITGCPILGEVADRMCLQDGITDSSEYARRAVECLRRGQAISHVSISIECARPRLSPHIGAMRESISHLLGIEAEDIGITVTSGEGLTEAGRGLGIAVMCVVTVTER
jgi:2-C-methyl-D-erythritol 2,4-cyclodiphosphate synthase